MIFKPNDEVICVDSHNSSLEFGREYTIHSVFDNYVNLVEEEFFVGGWVKNRFILATKLSRLLFLL